MMTKKQNGFRADSMVLSVAMFVVLISSVWAKTNPAEIKAGTTDFARYQIILERKPFGEILNVQDKNKGGTQVPAAESFAKHLKMVMVTATGGRVRVGLVDVGTQPNRNYYLGIGDVDDGIELTSASYEGEWAVLKKDGVEARVSMSGVGAAGGDSKGPIEKTPAFASAVRRLRESGPVQFRGLTAEEYRKGREAGTIPAPRSPARVIRGDTEPNDNLTPEEREAKMRAYNMDLIRAGGQLGVPLPIELTPEEDRQLVKEGVLSPQ